MGAAGHLHNAQLDELLVTMAGRPPFGELYRGLLLHHDGQAIAGNRRIHAALANLPPHEDRPSWHERIASYLIATGQLAGAVPWLQSALAMRPSRIDLFRNLVARMQDKTVPASALEAFLGAQDGRLEWRLYRALLAMIRALPRRQRPELNAARDGLDAVLPDVPRWRWRGELLAETRMQLGILNRMLGDSAAARRHFAAVAEDPAPRTPARGPSARWKRWSESAPDRGTAASVRT